MKHILIFVCYICLCLPAFAAEYAGLTGTVGAGDATEGFLSSYTAKFDARSTSYAAAF